MDVGCSAIHCKDLLVLNAYPTLPVHRGTVLKESIVKSRDAIVGAMRDVQTATDTDTTVTVRTADIAQH